MTKSSFGQSLSELAGSIQKYLEIRFNLAKLEAMEKLAKIISLFIAAIFLLLLFMLILIFISLGAAIWLGLILNSAALGYFCIAAFYFLLCLIVFLYRRKLFLNTVIGHLSEILFNTKNTKGDGEN